MSPVRRILVCLGVQLLIISSAGLFSKEASSEFIQKFNKWLNGRKYVEGKTFYDTAKKNEVPLEFLGKYDKLSDIMVRFGLTQADFVTSFKKNNGVCFAMRLSGHYHILFLGSYYAKEALQSRIRIAWIVKDKSSKELGEGLREIFGFLPEPRSKRKDVDPPDANSNDHGTDPLPKKGLN